VVCPELEAVLYPPQEEGEQEGAVVMLWFVKEMEKMGRQLREKRVSRDERKYGGND
jgi:hypothetical protein